MLLSASELYTRVELYSDLEFVQGCVLVALWPPLDLSRLKGEEILQDRIYKCGMWLDYLRFLVIIIVTTTTQCSVFHNVLPFSVSVDILL